MSTAAPTAADPSEVLIPAKVTRKDKRKPKPAPRPSIPVDTEAPTVDLDQLPPAPAVSDPPPTPVAPAPPPTPKPRPPAPPLQPGATPSLAEPLARALCPLLGQINPEGDPIFPAPECAAFAEEATRGMQTVLEALLRARRGNPDEVLAFSGHKLEVLAREHLPKNLQLPAKAAALAFLRGLFVLLPMVG